MNEKEGEAKVLRSEKDELLMLKPQDQEWQVDDNQRVFISLFENHLLILMRHVAKVREAEAAIVALGKGRAPGDPSIAVPFSTVLSAKALPISAERQEHGRNDWMWLNRDSLFHHGRQYEESAMIAVVFAAFTLEAYINVIGATYLPQNIRCIEGLIEKLSTPDKWLLVPQLAFGNGFSKSENRYRQIKELFQLRNDIAHSKPVLMTPVIPGEMTTAKPDTKELRAHSIAKPEAENAANTCLDAIKWIQPLLPDSRCALPDISQRIENILRCEQQAK